MLRMYPLSHGAGVRLARRVMLLIAALFFAAACDLPPETPTRPPTATFRLVAPSQTVAPLLPTLPDPENVGGPESIAALGFTPAAPPVVGEARVTVTPLPAPTAPAIPMQFPLSGGGNVAGLFAASAMRSAPAALLLHDSGGGKEDWRGVMDSLRNGGISVLAVDVARFSAGIADMQAVFARLQTLPGVNPDRVSVAGVGAGANLAFTTCGLITACRGAALISPRPALNSDPISIAVPAYGTRPIFLAASTADTDSARTVTELQTGLRGPKQVILAEEPESGFNLLDLRPDIVIGLTSFLRGGV